MNQRMIDAYYEKMMKHVTVGGEDGCWIHDSTKTKDEYIYRGPPYPIGNSL
jgi:hypothetical protein